MTNPTFLVNISWQPYHATGMTQIGGGGVTYSMPTYSGGYYVASMPEVKLSATGSSYTASLANLLAIVSTEPNPGYLPYNNIRTW